MAIIMCVLLLLPLRARGEVPAAAVPWQRELTRQAHAAWGLDAPIASLAAQIETESAWRPDARSRVGAHGLAQFMPRTAEWISGAYSALADNDPANPIWALRALATYDRYLWDRQPLAASDCDRGAFMQAAYNGGETALAREQDACLEIAACDPDRWWDNVERVRGRRAAWAFDENRNYPRRIRAREADYLTWGSALCR
jgi:soluble lytic murein transglycosylase-like protein